MMNWNAQFEDMLKAWTDTQKKTWDGYFESMQGLGKPQVARMWESTMSMGKEMLMDMLKTQMQGLKAWVDGLAKMEGVPAQVVDSARQFQEMTDRWNKTQSELLETWFGMLKKFTPTNPMDAWNEIPQSMFKTWQESTQGIMDAQAKWMRSWMDQTMGKQNNG
jgi:hypothetical protein